MKTTYFVLIFFATTFARATVTPLAPLPFPVTEAPALLQSPQNYEVFQRTTPSSGSFKLNLQIALPSADKIRVQVFSSQNSAVYLLAQEIPVSLTKGDVYSNSFQLPAGGWYQIQAEQVSTSTSQALRSYVSTFGVGDVFVTAGQSNATSAGQVLTSTVTGMVSAFVPHFTPDGHLTGTGSWQLNNDPQPPEALPNLAQAQAQGILTTNFGSVWPTMGDVLFQQLGIPIATAETGVGGTTIAQWQKSYVGSVAPYTRFVETVRTLVQTTGVRMILWDQGEGDNTSESLTYPLTVYGNKFKQLQSDLQNDVGQKIPWMMAKASFAPANPHLDGSPCDSLWAPQPIHSIVLSQEKLISDQAAFEGPNTDNYIGAGNRYPGNRGSCIHFSQSTEIRVGKDWAAQIMKTPFGKMPTGESVFPSVLNVSAPQCPPGGGNCTTHLSWNVPSASFTQLKVSVAGGSELYMGCDLSQGQVDATWIVPKVPYIFRLYSATDCDASHTNGLLDEQMVKATPGSSGGSTSNPNGLPIPSGRTPLVDSLGRGCDDGLCIWLKVRDIESDFRLDMRNTANTTGTIDWTYQQDRLFVSPMADGSYGVTLRLTEATAQQALQAGQLMIWVVNPASVKWSSGNLVQ